MRGAGRGRAERGPRGGARLKVPAAAAALLEDPGADVLLEALGALGCQCLLEPQRRARSLRWSGAALDPCPRGVSAHRRLVEVPLNPHPCRHPPGPPMPPVSPQELPEEQELLLLEPEEFVQGVAGLLQVLKGPRPAPRRTPCFPARLG